MSGVLTQAGIDKRNAYENNSTDKIKYENRYTTEYADERDSVGNYVKYKNYPLIYEIELDGIINGEPTGGTLGLSDQTSFIERLDLNLAEVSEKVTSAESIRPKQTYYKLGTSFDNTYKSYFKTYENEGTKSYADLLSPVGLNTNYWVASRCIGLNYRTCYFYVRGVNEGCINYTDQYGSGNGIRDVSRGLFPVVTLSSELISTDTQSEGQYKVVN